MKSASGFRSTFYLYGSVMCFNDLPGDSKSEAGAAGLVGYERFKCPCFLRGGHAAAVITDNNMYVFCGGFCMKTDDAMRMADRFLCIA